MINFSEKLALIAAALILAPGFAQATQAVGSQPFDIFDSDPEWNMFRDDDGIADGHGGQSFDTEYFFYKYDSDNDRLSIGLQTGFDLEDGYDGGYYTGDIALSFDGDASNYEYAVDFGLGSYSHQDNRGVSASSTDYSDSSGSPATDAAGLYNVGDGGWWNFDTAVYDTGSIPYAMDGGTLLSDANFTQSWDKGYVDDDYPVGAADDWSYYRIVSFDLDHIEGLSENFTVSAAYTMSCGNDMIYGDFGVHRPDDPPTDIPEPSIMSLMFIGSLGVGWLASRRRRWGSV